MILNTDREQLEKLMKYYIHDFCNLHDTLYSLALMETGENDWNDNIINLIDDDITDTLDRNIDLIKSLNEILKLDIEWFCNQIENYSNINNSIDSESTIEKFVTFFRDPDRGVLHNEIEDIKIDFYDINYIGGNYEQR